MAYFHCLIGGGSSGGGYELTVTCDADFAGTTITCTDGVTTLTQTCPSASPYEVVFAIPNGGDWTISGVVSGQTITTGVNIPTTATLEAIVQKTITIYSAKEDTITYTDIYGDTQTEVFASGESSKQITVDIKPNGNSFTFTSSVAKDPSNLSNYYSKTISIANNTSSVYLMPDGALYWYGCEVNIQDCSSANGWSATGYSWTIVPITHNTNNVSANGNSGTAVGAVGSSSKIDLTDFSYLKSIAQIPSTIGLVRLTNSKDFTNGSSIVATSAGGTRGVLSQLSLDVSSYNGEYYCICTLCTQSSGVGSMYALWLE